MDNEQLINQMKKIRNNLNTVKSNLSKAEQLLSESITINNSTFQLSYYNDLNNRINIQIKNLNNKIIKGLSDL